MPTSLEFLAPSVAPMWPQQWETWVNLCPFLVLIVFLELILSSHASLLRLIKSPEQPPAVAVLSKLFSSPCLAKRSPLFACFSLMPAPGSTLDHPIDLTTLFENHEINKEDLPVAPPAKKLRLATRCAPPPECPICFEPLTKFGRVPRHCSHKLCDSCFSS